MPREIRATWLEREKFIGVFSTDRLVVTRPLRAGQGGDRSPLSENSSRTASTNDTKPAISAGLRRGRVGKPGIVRQRIGVNRGDAAAISNWRKRAGCEELGGVESQMDLPVVFGNFKVL